MYKTILVPHAGTQAGDTALKHAIHIAKSSSAKILLLHVVEQIQHPVTFALSASERKNLLEAIKDANEAIKQEMEVKMKNKKALCKKSNLEAENMVVVGFPAEEILKVVKDKGVDLIVMAKRRKLSGIKRIFTLGSVSRKIVEHSPCPVLILE